MRVRLLAPNRAGPWLFAIVHLFICAVVFIFLYPASNWGIVPILLVDYPISMAFADSANPDAIMIPEFVIFGTLWWFLIGYVITRILEWFFPPKVR
ncbi:MAG: hypothetical protein ABI132_10900 [Rhodanobacteraceae bacterium]